MKDKKEIHVKSFDDMDKEELMEWLSQNIHSLSSYQLRTLCKRVKEMNDTWALAEKMISLGIKMGE